MKLELNKNELERALIALGKLVSRTASLPQFRSLKIEAKEKEIRFSTCTPLEQITFRMESPPEGSFHCIVPFEEFRMALRSCRNKTLELEYREGVLRVGETTLLHEQSVEWPIICKGEQEAYSELPKEFVSLLATAAPLVDREEARAIMRGINLSREGITATNGRELLHISLPLNVDDFTIPLPIALLQTRTKEGGSLFTWNSRAGKICRVETEHWIWLAYGLKGDYPNWRQIIPHPNSLVRSVSFLPERGEQLAVFLRNVPAQEPHNPVEQATGAISPSGSIGKCFSACYWRGIRKLRLEMVIIRSLQPEAQDAMSRCLCISRKLRNPNLFKLKRRNQKWKTRK